MRVLAQYLFAILIALTSCTPVTVKIGSSPQRSSDTEDANHENNTDSYVDVSTDTISDSDADSDSDSDSDADADSDIDSDTDSDSEADTDSEFSVDTETYCMEPPCSSTDTADAGFFDD